MSSWLPQIRATFMSKIQLTHSWTITKKKNKTTNLSTIFYQIWLKSRENMWHVITLYHNSVTWPQSQYVITHLFTWYLNAQLRIFHSREMANLIEYFNLENLVLGFLLQPPFFDCENKKLNFLFIFSLLSRR